MHDGLNAIKAALQKYTVSGVFSGVLLRPAEWVSKLVYSRLQSIDKFVLSNGYKSALPTVSGGAAWSLF